MDKQFLYELMENVRSGKTSIEDAVLQLKTEPLPRWRTTRK